MRNTDIMDNTYVGIAYNFFASIFGWVMIDKGMDSIPDSLIKVIVQPAAETGIDVTNKLLITVSTILTIIATGITIGQFIYKFFKNKK